MITGESQRSRDGTLYTLPEFALCWLPDDPDSPTEVTILPRRPGVDQTVEWISIDADHAVPLDEIR